MIGFLVFGLVVGALARLLVPGKQNMGLLVTLLIGIAGSLVGGLAANALGSGDLMELNVIGAVVAIVAAVVFILIGERVADGRAPA